MFALPSFLGFLLPLPALRESNRPAARSPHRHRAIHALRLSRHILKDAGIEDYDTILNDPRWVQRPDLER
ncbi:hypothetical protein [Devosia sp. Root685]|uniref:hypothetical protein n=1 Tax=Devosia sp. Root685 TaxID=1736587 RepID=UPI0006F47878|nr:hypothetical protein [Devosia sp. Root685]